MTERGPAGGAFGDGGFRNVFNGNADIVVQFRDNYGDIHFHAPPAETPEARATRALAEAVFRQWREEAKVWDIGGDRPSLAVRWKPRLQWARRAAPNDAADAPRGDQVPDMVAGFLGLPQRRLVILGGAGSGKTALAVLLTLELLKRRLTPPGGGEPVRAVGQLPVPVPMSMASWDPERETFDAWFIRRLAADYPGLPRLSGRHPAAELWKRAGSVVLPVLDGLDEMPAARRSSALHGLNRALYDGRPLILTSRTEAFEGPARDVMLRSTACLEAQPVEAGDAVTYLATSTAPHLRPRWQPLFQRIRATPTGPAASALSTPLMLWLARTVYADPATEPAELADPAAYPTRQAIEDHLLDRFVPAAFDGRVPSDDRWEPPRRWKAERARKYAETLAEHLARAGTPDLAWWRLHEATPWARVAAVPLLVVAGFLALQVSILAGGTIWGMAGRPSAVGGLLASASFGFGVLIGLGAQLAGRTWYTELKFGEPRRRVHLLRPGAALRSAVRATDRKGLSGALFFAIPAFVVGVWSVTRPTDGPLVWRICGGLCPVLCVLLAVMYAAPTDRGEDATTPRILLRSEHAAVLLGITVIGPVAGFGVGIVELSRSGASALSAGVAAWLGASMMLVCVSPWSRWLLGRTTLALTRRAPWGLPRYLADAHRQGVLRQTGGVYQFRSVRLQERLAETTPLGARRRARRSGRDALPPEAITHTSDAGIAFRLRVRRTNVAPLKRGVTSGVLLTLVCSMWGGMWLLLGPGLMLLGFLLTLLTRILPPYVVDLRLNRDTLECRWRDKYASRFEWRHVDEVAVHEFRPRGVSTGRHLLQVRLRPEALTPGERQAHDPGWRIVCDLGSMTSLPPQVDAALKEYSAYGLQPESFALWERQFDSDEGWGG
ncbi:hypothetical protein ABZ615_06805 [Streptomyces sp. NPDC007325]|uniref:hypothetical protein n=1 Tax=Streptomyces sp. NPDC007325 TaxID=3154588 RepID=UPI0033FC844C